MTHNKKRNTAFLFEALVKEQVECVLKKNDNKAKLIEKTINKFFAQGTSLGKELELYICLSESTNLQPELAERLITNAKESRDTIDESSIWSEQSRLIAFINKALGAHIYENFVPSYRILATINSLFNKKLPVKYRAQMEQKIKDLLIQEAQKPEEVNNDIDMLVFKKYVDNFNSQYSDLLEEQKELLSKFILHQFGSDMDFKIYMNEECGRILEVINVNMSKLVSPLKESVNQCVSDLRNINLKYIDETLMYQLMKYQELARTLTNENYS